MTVELATLDEGKMLDYVNDLIQNIPRYQLARNNCSHVVANCLMLGTASRPTFTPNAANYSKLGRLALGVWTPDQVLRFAQELKRHEDSLQP